MTTHNAAASFEAALRLCATREDVRILRRVRPISELVSDGPPIGRKRRIAIVDTETTSVDVQTAEARPYSVAFAICSASASVSNGMIERTGPKTSSLASVISGVTSRTVGCM